MKTKMKDHDALSALIPAELAAQDIIKTESGAVCVGPYTLNVVLFTKGAGGFSLRQRWAPIGPADDVVWRGKCIAAAHRTTNKLLRDSGSKTRIESVMSAMWARQSGEAAPSGAVRVRGAV